MKKITILFFTILILFTAGSCSKAPQSYDYVTNINGNEIIVSRDTGTISCNDDIYTYAFSYDGSLTITYPNGYIYSEKKTGSATASSWKAPNGEPSELSEEELGYIGGYFLSNAIDSAGRAGRSGNEKAISPVVSLLIIALGVWNITAPKSVWMISHGWKFKNAEPSDLILVAYRVAGAILAVVGLIALFA